MSKKPSMNAARIEIRRLATADAVAYRDLRLAALRDSPEAFGSTFERESTFRWPYRPGRIVGPASGPLNNDRLVRLPSLPDFADSTFVHAHCFRLVGQDTLAGNTFIRLDFAPVATLRATDVEGAAYMDPTSYQIRYTTVRLTRPEREMPGVAAMVATIHFSEIAPGILLHDHVRSVETFASSHTPTERIEEQRLLGVHFLRPLMRTQ